mmetsp:Transcript_29190/g.49095  ORF Transcript_29190/g.49095 Transcript_29190/m.49095 type:complete len:200 (+) Transcript_29190:1158-1757(+)
MMATGNRDQATQVRIYRCIVRRTKLRIDYIFVTILADIRDSIRAGHKQVEQLHNLFPNCRLKHCAVRAALVIHPFARKLHKERPPLPGILHVHIGTAEGALVPALHVRHQLAKHRDAQALWKSQGLFCLLGISRFHAIYRNFAQIIWPFVFICGRIRGGGALLHGELPETHLGLREYQRPQSHHIAAATRALRAGLRRR